MSEELRWDYRRLMSERGVAQLEGKNLLRFIVVRGSRSIWNVAIWFLGANRIYWLCRTSYYEIDARELAKRLRKRGGARVLMERVDEKISEPFMGGKPV